MNKKLIIRSFFYLILISSVFFVTDVKAEATGSCDCSLSVVGAVSSCTYGVIVFGNDVDEMDENLCENSFSVNMNLFQPVSFFIRAADLPEISSGSCDSFSQAEIEDLYAANLITQGSTLLNCDSLVGKYMFLPADPADPDKVFLVQFLETDTRLEECKYIDDFNYSFPLVPNFAAAGNDPSMYFRDAYEYTNSSLLERNISCKRISAENFSPPSGSHNISESYSFPSTADCPGQFIGYESSSDMDTGTGYFLLDIACMGLREEWSPAPPAPPAPGYEGTPFSLPDASGLNQFPNTSLPTLVGRVIAFAVLGILGAASLSMFIYAGLLWMFSGGNSERNKKALLIMLWTSMGIAVTLSSYAILKFIFAAFG